METNFVEGPIRDTNPTYLQDLRFGLVDLPVQETGRLFALGTRNPDHDVQIRVFLEGQNVFLQLNVPALDLDVAFVRPYILDHLEWAAVLKACLPRVQKNHVFNLKFYHVFSHTFPGALSSYSQKFLNPRIRKSPLAVVKPISAGWAMQSSSVTPKSELRS